MKMIDLNVIDEILIITQNIQFLWRRYSSKFVTYYWHYIFFLWEEYCFNFVSINVLCISCFGYNWGLKLIMFKFKLITFYLFYIFVRPHMKKNKGPQICLAFCFCHSSWTVSLITSSECELLQVKKFVSILTKNSYIYDFIL